MRVKDLIEQLQSMNPELELVMQKDSEGNGYSPLYCVDDKAVYVPDSTYSGEVYSTEWTWEDACFDSPEEWEEFKKKDHCVVLCPTN